MKALTRTKCCCKPTVTSVEGAAPAPTVGRPAAKTTAQCCAKIARATMGCHD